MGTKDKGTVCMNSNEKYQGNNRAKGMVLPANEQPQKFPLKTEITGGNLPPANLI